MSLQDIENIVTSINSTLGVVDTNISSILGSIGTLPAQASKTMTRANEIFDKLDPVLSEIHKISNLLLGILIMVTIIIAVMFIFWFFRHVYPIIRGMHKHEHTADNVVRDLTEVPVRFTSAT